MKRLLFSSLVACSLLTGSAFAQGMASADHGMPAYHTEVLKPDLPSPRKEMTGTIDGVKITINYGSPSLKGRVIWGGLEPYGKVWRAGANEATRITFGSDVTIDGKKIGAGTYGLFVLPEKEGAWSVIFNATAEQWGAFKYDESKDVLRVKVAPAKLGEPVEALAYMIEGKSIELVWGDLKLAVPVKAAM